MTQLLWPTIKRPNGAVISSCLLGFWLATTTVAQAEYTPPPDQKPPSGYTQSTGPRGGCEGHEDRSLTALAPQKHMGQTAKEHPTFAWYVPESKPLNMEFSLYQDDAQGELKPVYKNKLKATAGIMQLSLPKNSPGLTLGQRYIWQVAILCDPNHPSNDIVAKAEIEMVEMPSILKKSLAHARNRSAKIALLAKAGLWYDALAKALEPVSGSSNLAAPLIEDLAKLEETEAKQDENSQGAKLRQIARLAAF